MADFDAKFAIVEETFVLMAEYYPELTEILKNNVKEIRILLGGEAGYISESNGKFTMFLYANNIVNTGSLGVSIVDFADEIKTELGLD